MPLTAGLVNTAIVGEDRLITRQWSNYLRTQDQTITQTPTAATTPIKLTGKTASIGVTAIPSAALATGLYRVSYSVQVTTAAGVSSSITVTFTWTRGSVTQTFTGTAWTGNATTTNGSQDQLIRIDKSTPVSYSTTYASNPAAAMVYDLDIMLEQVAV